MWRRGEGGRGRWGGVGWGGGVCVGVWGEGERGEGGGRDDDTHHTTEIRCTTPIPSMETCTTVYDSSSAGDRSAKPTHQTTE